VPVVLADGIAFGSISSVIYFVSNQVVPIFAVATP